MIKYVPEDTQVVFAEIPDEVSLAINISCCPHRCPGCHSPYLQKDYGVELDEELNGKRGSDNRVISTADSKIQVMVIPTNEEVMIARDTVRVAKIN